MFARYCLLAALVLNTCSFALAQAIGERVSNRQGMSFVKIPEGEFLMGTTQSLIEISNVMRTYAGAERLLQSETPQHLVQISSFWLQTTEVTQAQWQSVMGTRPWHDKHSFVKEGAHYPAQYVSWNEAVEFCERLGKKDGNVYRLPTEAEWEYACRAGTDSLFSFGDAADQLDEFGWYDGNAYSIKKSYAHRTASRSPNPWGLYDMHGNVWEWCSDRFREDYYSKSPAKDPPGPDKADLRSMRGGSWRDTAFNSRSACRIGFAPDHSDMNVGFRVLCVGFSNNRDRD